jgi:hypothetical protein
MNELMTSVREEARSIFKTLCGFRSTFADLSMYVYQECWYGVMKQASTCFGAMIV